MYFSLPGAIMISFFFDRTLRKVRSFWGSMSLTIPRAFMSNWCILAAYWTVLALSRVLLMGMPIKREHMGKTADTTTKISLFYQFHAAAEAHDNQTKICNNSYNISHLPDTFCINNDNSLYSFLVLEPFHRLLHLSLQHKRLMD